MKKSKEREAILEELNEMLQGSEAEFSDDDLLMKPGDTEKPTSGESSLKRSFRNALVLGLCVAITWLWYFDWNLNRAVTSTVYFTQELMGQDDVQVVNRFNQTDIPVAPEVPGLDLDINLDTDSDLAMSMEEYVSTIRNREFGDRFDMNALTAFYQTGVPVEYIQRLHEAGHLENLSFPAVLVYHGTGISVEYLNALDENGYLGEFNFSQITAFHEVGIDAEYLNSLKERGLLSEMSFTEILIMYQNR